MTPMLEIADLRLRFRGISGPTDVLHGISLNIAAGEKVALVGESGSGKSVTARIVLGLLQDLPSADTSGLVRFDGRDLDTLTPKERAHLRGTEMSMIFQDPTSSLNPTFPIGRQFTEVLRRRRPDLKRRAAEAEAAALLSEVAIPDPRRALSA